MWNCALKLARFDPNLTHPGPKVTRNCCTSTLKWYPKLITCLTTDLKHAKTTEFSPSTSLTFDSI